MLRSPESHAVPIPRPSSIEKAIARKKAQIEREAIRKDAAAIRERCQSLIGFVREFWPIIEPGRPFVYGWAIEAIALHLEAVSDGKIQYLLINVPPGMMKSLLVSVFWPAWRWAVKDESLGFLASSFSMENVSRDNLKMRRIIESDKFQAIFGDRVTPSKRKWAERRFETEQSGIRAGRAFRKMTGGRGDCLLAGTMIETDRGKVAIEHIVNDAKTCNVLSYDEHSNRLVYRPVEAVARRSSQAFYRVHFASGGMAECTGDHRFYTARGYVEARFLSADDVLMRAVRGADQTQCVRLEEGGKGRVGEPSLQPPLFANRDQHRIGKDGDAVQRVRCADREQGAAMLRPVPRGGAGAVESGDRQQDTGAGLRHLQHNIPTIECEDEGPVLLPVVRERGSFTEDARSRQSRLAERDERASLYEPILAAVSEAATEDHRARFEAVRRLQGDRGFVRPSHRHGPGAERLGEPRHAMQAVSCDAAYGGTFQTVADAVALVERICEPATVYDLQVAGTRCFFANGRLTHNCVIIDDPHDVDGGESDTERPNTVRTFREAIPDRLNDMSKSAIVVIMQRLHAQDVSGEILRLKLPYVHLRLPMEFEPTREENGQQIDNVCRTYVDADRDSDGNPLPGAVPFFTDPRTFDGELLFPERFPEKVCEGLKISKGSYAYAGQYQQRPSAREGGLFKRHWFAGKIIDRALVPTEGIRNARAWDFAGSEARPGAKPDWTAGVGGFRHGKDYYVTGVERDQLSPMNVEKRVKATAETDPLGTIIRIPIDPSQAGLYQAVSYVALMAGYALKMEKPKGDKVDRAFPSSVQAEYGHIYLVNSGPPDQGLDPWINKFLDELCAFPTGVHDDQVDAFADWFNELSLHHTGAFSSVSAGPSETVAATEERDSRYRFSGDAQTGMGYGSVPSTALGISF